MKSKQKKSQAKKTARPRSRSTAQLADKAASPQDGAAAATTDVILPEEQLATEPITAVTPTLSLHDLTITKPAADGGFELTVRIGRQECKAVVHTHDLEALTEIAREFARDTSRSEADFANLEELVREKLDEINLPSPAQAMDLVNTTLESIGKDAVALPQLLNNAGFLKSMYVLSCRPTGDFEAVIDALSESSLKAKQITTLRRAIKQVGERVERKPSDTEAATGVRYRATPDGFVGDFPGRNGGPKLLCNFTAEIMEDIEEDDGSEKRRLFRMRGLVGEAEYFFLVPASDFPSLKWVLANMGANATIYPGYSEHIRAAVQLNSNNISKRVIYTHTGWTLINGENAYLHAGGAIGQDGPISGVEVELRGELARYHLPPPPDDEELRECIRASLALRKLAPIAITCCLEGATFRAALGGHCDTSVWIAGQTGNGKSELAARYQQHYGSQLDRMGLPGNWSSTGNSLEAAAHAAKDAVFVIDDFCPTGTGYDVAKYNQTAERLIRALRNQAGRQRLTQDGRLRTTKTPRCVAICTGEDVPEGHSLRASMMICELSPGELDFQYLQECQRLGGEGTYARVMARFTQWLACCNEGRFDDIATKIADYRSRAAASGTHKRTPELVANLAVGIEYFLAFAEEMGAITSAEKESLFDEAWSALGTAAEAQAEYLSDADSAKRFLNLLRSCISCGRAHVATEDGRAPKPTQAALSLGWKKVGNDTQSQGTLIGWVKGNNLDDVYIDVDAAYRVVQDAARNNQSIPVTTKTLTKRLRDAGLLATHGEDRGRVLVRVQINGTRREVLHFKLDKLLGDRLPDYDAFEQMYDAPATPAESKAAQGVGGSADKDDDAE